jgi:tRNA(Ile)-lysidine synthetase-like protein
MDFSDTIVKNDTIISFWKSHSEFWIPISEIEKLKADKTITELFFDYDYSNDCIFGKIIYLDQFSRHFQRYLQTINSEMSISEEIIVHNRKIAKTLMLEHWDLLIHSNDEVELIFGLMPFKHLYEYNKVLDFLDWNKALKPLTSKLSKFYNDTYEKAYTYETIKSKIFVNDSFEDYNHDELCDFYPESYNDFDLSKSNRFDYTVPKEIRESFKDFDKKTTYIVSLSGGVDSMVMLAMMVALEIPVIAVHIVYGNREASIGEYNFISHYCQKLNVKLYVYNIERLKRGLDDREFYEAMTRTIRFDVYKSVASIESIQPNILLGHIQEDIVENIWTNLSLCQHLGNLKKMKTSEVFSVGKNFQRVTVVRPFLNLNKDSIYSVSKELSIPYLKNTTPSWSNRGKFREKFYKATHEQYGASVDAKIIEVATLYEHQSKMIEKLLYKPIFESYNHQTNTMDITLAVNSESSEAEFSHVFEHTCHKLLNKSKPSIHSIRNFCTRLHTFIKSNENFMKVNMKKDLVVSVTKKDGNYTMKF